MCIYTFTCVMGAVLRSGLGSSLPGTIWTLTTVFPYKHSLHIQAALVNTTGEALHPASDPALT